jgi:hypothetical protein
MRKRSRKQEPDINQIAFRIVKDSTSEPDLSNDDARRALAQALEGLADSRADLPPTRSQADKGTEAGERK